MEINQSRVLSLMRMLQQHHERDPLPTLSSPQQQDSNPYESLFVYSSSMSILYASTSLRIFITSFIIESVLSNRPGMGRILFVEKHLTLLFSNGYVIGSDRMGDRQMELSPSQEMAHSDYRISNNTTQRLFVDHFLSTIVCRPLFVGQFRQTQ